MDAAMLREIEDQLTVARDRLWREVAPIPAAILGDFSEITGPFRFAPPRPVGPDQRPTTDAQPTLPPGG